MRKGVYFSYTSLLAALGSRRCPWPLTLEIFAPLDLRRAYTAHPAKEALTKQLCQRHWQDTPSTFPALELQEQFWTQHASFHRELTCDLRPKVPLNAAEVPGVAGVERIDMWVQVTGECLVSCTYTLEPTALDSGDAFRAYHRLDAHFRRVFSTVAAPAEIESLLGKLPSGADDVLDRDIIGTSPGPHWTHGVYVHVAVAPDSLLCADKLKALAGETMQTVTVVRCPARRRCGPLRGTRLLRLGDDRPVDERRRGGADHRRPGEIDGVRLGVPLAGQCNGHCQDPGDRRSPVRRPAWRTSAFPPVHGGLARRLQGSKLHHDRAVRPHGPASPRSGTWPSSTRPSTPTRPCST